MYHSKKHPSPIQRSERLVFAVAVLGLAAFGCAAEEPQRATQLRTLVDHSAWASAELAADPLRAHQPESVVCGIAGWYVEYGQLEIDTARCNYAWIEHPAQVAIPIGSQVTTVFSHFDLAAPEPADAHAAVLFGDAIQWETVVTIPQPGNALELAWEASVALEVGDPIRVHLHNHGQNFWSVASLMAHVPVSDP